MEIWTERLILRPWKDSDAENLYKYAKDPDVGPIAGWPVHTSAANSLEIIRTVFAAPEIYAVCLKEDNQAIGSAGLMAGKCSSLHLPDSEAEIGYWIGVPFWGHGLIPEAVMAIMHRGFAELELEKIWCSYTDGNEKSRRVQEKCGFIYDRTEEVFWEMTGDRRRIHVSSVSREEFLRKTV